MVAMRAIEVAGVGWAVCCCYAATICGGGWQE